MFIEEDDFPIKELHESLKRYSDAKTKVGLYQERLWNEAENLFSYFVKYARKEQNEDTYSFSRILGNFYSDILNMDCDSKDKGVRASLTKRFKKLLKRHNTEGSRYQIKLDEFML